MDRQNKGLGKIVGIPNAMLQKITEHPMATENYECRSKTPNEQNRAYHTGSHTKENGTLWTYLWKGDE